LIDQILALPAGSVRVADIGAAFYGEVPPYQRLLDSGLGRLYAFEPDSRYAAPLRQRLGSTGMVFEQVIGDGHEHTLYLCDYGLTSLLEPDPDALAFFNTLTTLGRVRSKSPVATRRLDDIDDLPQIVSTGMVFEQVTGDGHEHTLSVQRRVPLKATSR
jgi:hypothetical protein